MKAKNQNRCILPHDPGRPAQTPTPYLQLGFLQAVFDIQPPEKADGYVCRLTLEIRILIEGILTVSKHWWGFDESEMIHFRETVVA